MNKRERERGKKELKVDKDPQMRAYLEED